jgi:organic radical activating enzyme
VDKPLTFGADRLVLSEVFDTVQGEGPSMGRAATFLRLGHCNLRCGWCDTKYTWDWAAHDLRAELRVESLEAVAEDLTARAPRLVVVTGGEPLLQTAALVPLLEAVVAADKEVEIETAGTLSPSRLHKVTRWNVSPKLAGSGNPLAKRVRPEVLAEFAALPNAIFKLVVDSPEDLDEARALVRAYEIRTDRVWLMPQGRDTETLRQRSLELVPTCIEEGFHLGHRLHVTLWGDQRGV